MKWRVVLGDGLVFTKNENKAVGSVIADTCEVLTSGALCFEDDKGIVSMFNASIWLNVERVDEETEPSQNVANKGDS